MNSSRGKEKKRKTNIKHAYHNANIIFIFTLTFNKKLTNYKTINNVLFAYFGFSTSLKWNNLFNNLIINIL